MAQTFHAVRGPRPQPVKDDDTKGTTQVRLSSSLIRLVDDFAERFPLEGERNEIIRSAIREYLRARDPKWGGGEEAARSREAVKRVAQAARDAEREK